MKRLRWIGGAGLYLILTAVVWSAIIANAVYVIPYLLSGIGAGLLLLMGLLSD